MSGAEWCHRAQLAVAGREDASGRRERGKKRTNPLGATGLEWAARGRRDVRSSASSCSFFRDPDPAACALRLAQTLTRPSGTLPNQPRLLHYASLVQLTGGRLTAYHCTRFDRLPTYSTLSNTGAYLSNLNPTHQEPRDILSFVHPHRRARRLATAHDHTTVSPERI